MKMWILVGAFVLCGCEAGIGPDPTDDTSGSGTSAASGSGSSGATGSGSTGSGSTGSGTNNQGYESGSRLKVRELTASDGATQQLGFFDTQLQQNCSFVKADDGQLRCLPLENVAYLGSLYADPACNVGRLASTPCAGDATLVVAPDGCGGGYRVFEDLGPYSGQQWLKSAAGCTPAGMAAGAHQAGAEVPLSTYVSATETK